MLFNNSLSMYITLGNQHGAFRQGVPNLQGHQTWQMQSLQGRPDFMEKKKGIS